MGRKTNIWKHVSAHLRLLPFSTCAQATWPMYAGLVTVSLWKRIHSARSPRAAMNCTPSAAISGRHHNVNTGAFIVCAQGSGALMDEWWSMRQPPDWKPTGRCGTSIGYEQHAFDQFSVDKPGVFLCSQGYFCEQQRQNNETPFMHFLR